MAFNYSENSVLVVNSQREYDFFCKTKVPTRISSDLPWGIYTAVLDLPETKLGTYNYGKPLTEKQFWDMLKYRGVERPSGNNVRIGSFTCKGVDLGAFIEPISRWCHDLTPTRNATPIAVTPVTEVTIVTDGGTFSSSVPSYPYYTGTFADNTGTEPIW